MSHSPRPTMNKQNSNHEPRRSSLVNTRKGTRREIFSGQVTSTKTTDHGTKNQPTKPPVSGHEKLPVDGHGIAR
jgi:hypothetical protein